MNLKKSALLLLLIVGACEGDVVKRGGGKSPEGLSPSPDIPLIGDPDDRDPTGAGGDVATGGTGSPGSGGLFGVGGSDGTGGVPSASGGTEAASGGAVASGGLSGDGDMGGAAGANFGGMGGDTPLWH